ncbi:MAG: hypothetical protein Q9190_001541 [Brigantiaea leucoxantha]
MLNSHKCDALVVPAFCHTPADLGQCPVISLNMGFFPGNKAIERSDGDLVSKGPNIPVGLFFIGRKWDDAKLLGLGHAYEQAFAVARKELDKPMILPTTELRDVINRRTKGSNGARI